MLSGSRRGRRHNDPEGKFFPRDSEQSKVDLFWSGLTYVPYGAILFRPGEGVLQINRVAHAIFECRAFDEITQIFRDGLDPSLHLRMMNAARGGGASITDMPVRLRARGVNLSLSLSVTALPQFAEETLALLFLRELNEEQVQRVIAPVPSALRMPDAGAMQDLLSKLPQPGWILHSNVISYQNGNYNRLLTQCARAFIEGSPNMEALCQGCNPAPHMARTAFQQVLQQVRHTGAVSEYSVDFGDCGAWTLLLAPCGSSQDAEIACIAVPASESTAAASIAGTLVSLEDRAFAIHRRGSISGSSAIEALQEARDLERNAIAREIHDALGQELTVIRLSLRRLWHGLKAHADVSPHLEVEAAIIRDQLDKVTSSARRIAHELRSDGVKSQGFSFSAHSLVANFQDRLGLQGQMEVSSNFEEPDQAVGWQMYRTLQELLNNIAKHANAQRFNVRVGLDEGAYRLEVSDDGVGIPAEAVIQRTGMGLRSIEERAQICNGEVLIRARPEVPGTVVEVVIPVPAPIEI